MKRRILAFFLGVMTLVICVEIGLHLVGRVHLHRATAQNDAVRNSDYRILCVGDSFTYGIGASEGKDYPRQLEDVFKANLQTPRVAVVNRGVGAYNTSQIRHHLPKWIQESDPHLVVILAGSANAWNYWGYRDYLKGNGLRPRLRDFFYRIRIFKLIRLLGDDVSHDMPRNREIQDLEDRIQSHPELLENYLELGRIYQDMGDVTNAAELFKKAHNRYPEVLEFYRQIAYIYLRIQASDDAVYWFSRGVQAAPSDPSNLENYLELGRLYKRLDDFTRAIEWLEAAHRAYPHNVKVYREIGNVYLRVNDPDKAIGWFKKGIQTAPSDSSCYTAVGDAYNWIRKHDEAIKWFKKAILINPRDAGNYTGIGYALRDSERSQEAISWFLKAIQMNPQDISTYYGLAEAYNDTNDGVTIETLEALKNVARQNPLADEYIEMFSYREQKEDAALIWMERDIQEMIRLCKANGIRIILHNYPFEKDQFAPTAVLAEKNGVLFVDNQTVFNTFWKRGEPKDKYFVPDGHCNDLGYRVMAENLYQKIIEEKLIATDLSVSL